MPLEQVKGQLHDEFTIANIGANLLRNLAEGLYSPAEVVREYVQNAIDAHRLWEHVEAGELPTDPVQIEVLDEDLVIIDYGIGMNEAGVKAVKDISVSSKPLFDVHLTGHKGVGIWAGLSYFDQLTLFTSTRGDVRGYKLTLRFREMADLIRSSKVHSLHVGEVLNPNFTIEYYDEEVERHGTIVRLSAPRKNRDSYLNVDWLAAAIRERCPCEIDETFALSSDVKRLYKLHNIQTFPIHVDGKPVTRSFPSNVEGFVSDAIRVGDSPIAVYWKAVHNVNGILNPAGGQVCGLRLYQTGFEIAGQNPYSRQSLTDYPTIKLQDTYPNWYIGEFHVVSDVLTPNLPRKDFEESEDRRKFVTALRSWWAVLDADTRLLSEVRNVRASYTKYESAIARIRDVHVPRGDVPGDAATEVADVQSIVQSLKEDEQSASRRKHGKDPLSTKVEARKQVANERRKLLNSAESLLATLTDVAGSDSKLVDELAPLPDEDGSTVGGEIPLASSEQVPDAASLEEKGIPRPIQTSLLVVLPITVDTDEEPIEMPYDVILGLLTEVLADELKDERRVNAVLTELSNRVGMLLANE
jgi:hypothetical protein